MRPQVRAAVDAGLGRWLDRLPPSTDPIHLRSEVLRLQASRWTVLKRLGLWKVALLAWLLGIAWDGLRGKGGPATRAARASRLLQGLGGTFVKLGQQLSLRADLLAPEWCDALAELRDNAPPMDPSVAQAVIERSTGRPLRALFSAVDWTPLGSASIACVYGATLPSGRRVAVKVRRPDVAASMAADLAILRRLASLAQSLNIVRREQGVAFVEQLQVVLLDELDLRRELRNLECFRRSAKETGLRWLRAPRPYPERCSPEVLTVARVEALPAAVVLAAAEGDPVAKAQVRAAGISPRRAGQRLFRAWNEQVFHFERFHGDPHPANLFVGPGDVLWLVDFGACGAFSEASRRVLRRIQVAVLARDIGEMVQGALALVEPHPPIDMDRVGRRLERLYGDYLASVQSDAAPWWEKATSRFWMSFIEVAREYGIPVNLDTLRLFRASFLMDTLAYRLAPDLDIRAEYRWFFERESRRRNEQIQRDGLRAIDGAPLMLPGRIQDALHVGERAVQRVERLLDQRTSSFGLAAGKGAAAFGTLVRTLIVLIQVALFGGIAGWAVSTGFGHLGVDLQNPLLWLEEPLHEAFRGDATWGVDDLLQSPLLWLLTGVVLLMGLWDIRRRLEDVDP